MKSSLLNDVKKNLAILMTNCIYYLFTGMSEAAIGKEVYEILPPQLISFQQGCA